LRFCVRVLSAVVVLAVLAPPAVASSSSAIVVDAPPEIECPEADFVSIQAAVAAATAGSTIKVCPGLYNESVVVPKPLRLSAPRHKSEATRCPSDPATDPTRYAIVDSPGLGDGFRLQADGIVLEGFVAQGNLTGIVTDPAFAGHRIRRAISQGNNVGIALGGSGALESAVAQSCVRNTSVGLSSFSLRRAQIRGNELTGNNVGISLFGGGDVEVIHNSVSESPVTAMRASRAANVSVRHNHVARAGAALLYDGSTGDIRFNLIEGAVAEGIQLRSSAGVVARFNHVRESGVGVRLLRTSGTTVERNAIERSQGHGILLELSDTNAVERNLSRDNGGDGLRVASQSSANNITGNALLGNGEYDCHDDTVGAGTAGTANFWIRNLGQTENRPGLCTEGLHAPALDEIASGSA
jgi:nitrous oxidase accessory protein NosD